MKKGDRVKVKYDGEWYKGTVSMLLKGNKVKVNFDDGDVIVFDRDYKYIKSVTSYTFESNGELMEKNIDFNTSISFAKVFNPSGKYVKDYKKRSGEKTIFAKGKLSRGSMYGILNSFIDMENLTK